MDYGNLIQGLIARYCPLFVTGCVRHHITFILPFQCSKLHSDWNTGKPMVYRTSSNRYNSDINIRLLER